MENLNNNFPGPILVSDHEDDETTDNTQSSQATLGKRKPKRRSEVWNHFVKTPKGSRAVCNYCQEDFACEGKTHGTSTLRAHMGRCKKFPGRQEKEDPKQTTLVFKNESGELVSNLTTTIFTKEKGRRACVEYIVGAELPFKHIENRFFKQFCLTIQPRLVLVSRVTIARDVFQTYLEERKSMKSILGKYRVSLTTDTWRSIQNLNYMCVTAHFIDDDWKLHKRIINFFLVPNHKGDTIGRELETCIREWGITKLVSITVDNASSNDTAMTYLQKRLQDIHGCVLLDGKSLHIRCCAHIVNLIVTEGLKEIDDSVDMIRNAVKYVRSSVARAKKFDECVVDEKIDSKAHLCLDVTTRWNSTYLMLETAIKYQKAFDLMIVDGNYENYFREKEDGKQRKGPPTDIDWEKAREYVTFLKTFYEVTLKFSGTQYTTANLFFREIFEVRQMLTTLMGAQTSILRNMAFNMKAKFDKYWGDADKINDMLIIAAVLDPRYKMGLVKVCIEMAFNDLVLTDMVCFRITNTMQNLLTVYKANGHTSSKEKQNSQSQSMSQSNPNSSAILSRLMETCDFSHGARNEVDMYLSEPREPVVMNAGFDILSWWKLNTSKYPILSSIARDILAAQVSTVASESAFSTGGRVLDKFRSSLHPRMVEALICLRDWLIGDDVSLMVEELKEEVENLQSSESIVKTEMIAVSLNSESGGSCSVSGSGYASGSTF